jgi:hypothetical protein
MFHTAWDNIMGTPKQLFYYSKIDATANNGLGKVIDKNHLISEQGAMGGYVTVTKHANGRDWWVVSHHKYLNKYYISLVTPDGVRPPLVQFIGDSNNQSCCGWTMFSPNGEKYFRCTPHDGVKIFDFDRCTGELSNPVRIDSLQTASSGPSGLSVSNDNHYLYVSTNRYVLQYDLTATDIAASRQLLAEVDWAHVPEIGTFHHSLLAPDGKIYMISFNYVQDMTVIHFPERQGAACKVEQHGFKLPALYGNDFIFNFPHYRLGPIDGSACDTLGINNLPLAEFRWAQEDSLTPLQISFSEVCSYEPDTWHWEFGDGNISEERNPIHVYNKEDVFQVCLTASNANGSDTRCKTLYLGASAAKDPLLETTVDVGPNPFSERLYLSLAVELLSPELRLLDQLGRVAMRTRVGVGMNEINTEQLKQGLYFWELCDGQGTRLKSGKLVKGR